MKKSTIRNLKTVCVLIIILFSISSCTKGNEVVTVKQEVIEKEQSTGTLIKSLRDNDHKRRKYAAEALGARGEKRAVKPLIRVLNDRDSFVKNSAVWALGEIGHKQAAEPLITALNDKEWGIRRSAAEALGNIKDTRAIKPLLASLNDEDQFVRNCAAGSLLKMGVCTVDIVRVLNDTDWDPSTVEKRLGY